MVVSRDVTVGGQRPVLDPDLLAGGNVPLAAVEVLADPVGDAGLDVSVHDSPPSPDSTLARRPVPRPAFRQARHGCSTCGVPQLRRRPLACNSPNRPVLFSATSPVRAGPSRMRRPAGTSRGIWRVYRRSSSLPSCRGLRAALVALPVQADITDRVHH